MQESKEGKMVAINDMHIKRTHITMPKEAWGKHCTLIFRLLIGVDNMNVIKISSSRHRCCGVFVESAKICTKLSLSINIKVCLTSKEDYSAGRDEPRQIIFLGVRELGEIHAMYLGADFRVVIEDIRGIGEEIRELRITVDAFVVIRNLCQWCPADIGKSRSKIFMLVLYVLLNNRRARLVHYFVLWRVVRWFLFALYMIYIGVGGNNARFF